MSVLAEIWRRRCEAKIISDKAEAEVFRNAVEYGSVWDTAQRARATYVALHNLYCELRKAQEEQQAVTE